MDALCFGIPWSETNRGAMCSSSGLRRASDDSDQVEYEDEPAEGLAAMTEEQREYLRWYYRTEDRKFCCCGFLLNA